MWLPEIELWQKANARSEETFLGWPRKTQQQGEGDLLTQRRKKGTQLGRAVTSQGTSRRLKSDLGRALPGWQSRSKLSMVQLRCSVTDVCAPRAGWHPPCRAALSPERSKALCQFCTFERRLSEVSISTEGWAVSRSSGGLIRGQVLQ